MIEVNITRDIVIQARQNAESMGALRNSITAGEGNLAGFIGEIVVARFLNARIENTYDYDLVLDGIKIDVKTKRTSVKPQLHYECSVAAFNTKQKCDWYVFVRVKNDDSKAWILGYLPKDEYYRSAKLLKKGDVDPSNNFTVHADCYNVSISSLRPLVDVSEPTL